MNLLEALPPLDLFVPFLVAGIALNLTPGSDMTFVALSGARGGRRAGVAAAMGIFAGCLGHIVLAAVGMSALIAASQTAYAVVKWAGVAYLVFLAVQLLRKPAATVAERGKRGAYLPVQAFRQAALVNLLNPKVAIFFIAFLPQFVDPHAAAPWLQILALGIVFNTTGVIVNGAVGLFSAALAGSVGARPWIASASRWFAATVLGGLAVKLASSRNA